MQDKAQIYYVVIGGTQVNSSDNYYKSPNSSTN